MCEQIAKDQQKLEENLKYEIQRPKWADRIKPPAGSRKCKGETDTNTLSIFREIRENTAHMKQEVNAIKKEHSKNKKELLEIQTV